MNNILEGYYPDEVIGEQTGCTVRSIRRIRATSPDAPPYIVVKRKPLSKLEHWREFFERRQCKPNPRRQPSTRRSAPTAEASA